MQIDFILPDIGEGIVECELVEWLVKEGDQIVEDQPVADVMTDKALVQIPAMHSGKVTKLYYQQGEIAKVHTPLFALLPEGASEPLKEAVSTAVVAPPVASSEAQGSQLKDFILPDIGEGIVECELVEWLVKEGDWVEEDQPVADVMTDKALVQIPSMDSGRIHKLYYRQGEIAKVHSPLFAIEVATEATSSTHSTTPAATSPNQPQASHHPVAANAQPSLARPGKALASPAVRRLAREHNLDLSQIPGSGKDGRVLKEDILQWQQGQQQSKSCPAKAPSPALSAVSNSNTAGDRVEPIRGIRAAMARQMVDSVSTIPHFTYAEEIDVTALDALRQQLKGRFAEAGLKLTAMPLIMKAMALAIRDFPVLNARVNDDCTELTYLDSINIGMAVDTPIGLLVPNVKRVQDKSLKEVTAEVNRLTESARAGRVSPEDLKGGTISISNIGALGGTVATPIINKPEVAIVALGKIQTLPRFNSAGQVEARKIMQVSWSGDHRVIDGGTIARFCNQWKTYLEDPVSMLSELR
ncbi:dihydrolipoyllysine-residue acetyltransferase [Balneatrix alpica]|uniref:Dihydrolipoamide acetyltransferase component of pyruvate dehydrogenase complex n=1 Tax=Balneatrix alpica TaxID=75684 RepID=A0ABV5ZA19_9GAMM|nr:dihydrolipoyllysine-residue acetyltransferase [Balneatrix alpica]